MFSDFYIFFMGLCIVFSGICMVCCCFVSFVGALYRLFGLRIGMPAGEAGVDSPCYGAALGGSQSNSKGNMYIYTYIHLS